MTMNRRHALKTGLSAATLGAIADFEWILPALAQGHGALGIVASVVSMPHATFLAPTPGALKRSDRTRPGATVYPARSDSK